jgi:hypothetical protein
MMKGHAPGWQLRCTKCGTTWPAAESGIVRIKAVSWKKVVLRRCRYCDQLWFLVLEKVKDTSSAD